MQRLAMALQIGRRGHHDARAFAERQPDQRVVGLLAEADRAVEAVGDQVGNPVRQVECDRDLRMQTRKFRRQRCHEQAAEPGGRRDAQVAAGFDATCRDSAARPASSRATGTRNGEQDT